MSGDAGLDEPIIFYSKKMTKGLFSNIREFN